MGTPPPACRASCVYARRCTRWLVVIAVNHLISGERLRGPNTLLAGNFLQASGAFFDCSDGLRLACLQAIEMFRHATDSAEPDFAGFDTKEPLNNSARARFTGKGAAAALSSPDWSVPSTLANIRTVRWPDSTCLTSAELSKCCSISV